jgi:carbamoyl-phosphate synthase large subunit
VPFVAKATGVPLAKVAARVMLGATLAELRDEGLLRPPVTGDHVAVKEAVLPFNRFPDADAVLGPEMRSTGEVMGIDLTVGLAFAKSQLAAGTAAARRRHGVPVARRPRQGRSACGRPTFRELGFRSWPPPAAPPAPRAMPASRWPVVVAKLGRGPRAPTRSSSSSGRVDLVINSPRARPACRRRPHPAAAGEQGVPLLTTAAAGLAAANGMADRARTPCGCGPCRSTTRSPSSWTRRSRNGGRP